MSSKQQQQRAGGGGQEGAGVRQRTKKEDSSSKKKEGAPGGTTTTPQNQKKNNAAGTTSASVATTTTPPLPVRAKAQLLLAPEGNRQAFTKLMYATVAMILLPVLTYFFAYHVVPPAFDVAWSENVKAVVAGVSAVAMVQTIIIGYILSAFRE